MSNIVAIDRLADTTVVVGDVDDIVLLGTVAPGSITFTQANSKSLIATGNLIPCVITDGLAWEIGLFNWQSSGTRLIRSAGGVGGGYTIGSWTGDDWWSEQSYDWPDGSLKRVYCTGIGDFANIANRRHNFAATTDPGVGNDYISGYGAGSFWMNVSSGSLFTCLDPSNSAAVWQRIQTGAGFVIDRTITAGGTTGARTINKASGSVNFAAAASTLVVTNSLVAVSSIVVPVVHGADATLTSCRVTTASGSFTLTGNAAATAETRVSFVVFN